MIPYLELLLDYMSAVVEPNTQVLQTELSRCAENMDNWSLFENRLHWQFKVKKKSTNGCFWAIYLFPYEVLDNHNTLQYCTRSDNP
jgi:hypothetical protein